MQGRMYIIIRNQINNKPPSENNTAYVLKYFLTIISEYALASTSHAWL